MPIDINEIRDYKGGDPAKWRTYMSQRFKPTSWVDDAIAKDEEWRTQQKLADNLRREINSLQKQIAPMKKAKQPCDELVSEMKSKQKNCQRD
mmetsp:Transcript_25153/g.29115  ORF Transcript_25153/g.29115 Transcript_25153/m.29115 type:complete len:92 (+) Transcript_25153:93-368(+)